MKVNWNALIKAIATIVTPLIVLYILLVIGGLLAKLLWGFLSIILLILTILALYWAYDDETRNKP